ncbi:glycosyl hydrolase family 65 protein [Micromonospora sp. NPDC050200]|uniref:glycoside hydrolase family 65 protein n=1 Tax=Micromonospora sp. NPDC050200 TaxID=3155664 RepID=UPI0033CBF992
MGWALAYQDGDGPGEGTRETMLTLGNGYLATRGAAPEARADGVRYPGTYLGGFHNRLSGTGGPDGTESIVNLPNWLPLTFRPAGGDWLTPGQGRRVHEHRMLDLRRGVYRRELLVVDRDRRRTRIRQRRLVSMANPHLAALETSIVAENWSGRLEIRSGIDGRVVNANAPAEAGSCGRHLTDVATGGDDTETVWLTAVTTNSRHQVAVTARTRITDDGVAHSRQAAIYGPDDVSQVIGIDVTRGERVCVEKTVAVFSTRDRVVSEPLTAAREELRYAGAFGMLLAEHVAAWARLWERFRLDVGEEHAWQLPVRVQTFHLLQTLSPHIVDLDAGVPARGLHGEGYHGHIFWDELFVYPYLNLRLPELTRALLEYRHRRLTAARRQAAAVGMVGALFPWQSGASGRDESPRCSPSPITGEWVDDYTGRQQHVNLAVAYSAWRYWETTGDLPFLAGCGLELLAETARFWAGLATYQPSDDRYDIRAVMGPDEYHDSYPGRPGQGLDNSAYINVMVSWVLGRAEEACAILSRHPGVMPRRREVAPTDDERRRWRHIERRLRLAFLDDGILAQFEGYDDLAELDWDRYRRRYGDLRLLGSLLQAEGEDPNRYKISKQADVLMLLYLFGAEELAGLVRGLGYEFDPARIPATVDYYLSRTTHGSTLSRVAHAWVLARTDRRRSFEMLLTALGTDLADPEHNSSRNGIHLGATAGTLDILQRCYIGLEVRGDVLRLNPLLPDGLDGLDCVIRYHNQLISLNVDHERLRICAHPGSDQPVRVAVRDSSFQLAPGSTVTVALRPSTEPAGESGDVASAGQARAA